MKKVLLISSFLPKDSAYAEWCVLHSLSLGEMPICFLLQFEQLDGNENEAAEMSNSALASLAWINSADILVVYIDKNVSESMQTIINAARDIKIPIEFRRRHFPNLGT